MDFRRSLAISLAFHITLLIVTSLHLILPRHKYIIVPVDLMYYSAPAVNNEEMKKKEEEVVIPQKKREIKKKKQEPPKEKKEEKKTVQPQPVSTPNVSPAEAASNITADTAKFPYLYYLKKVRESISRNWGWHSSSSEEKADIEGTLKTVVYFKILKDGTITPPVFKERSGYAVFDALALRAVSVSSPFPPLPSGYEDDSLGIYFEFSYRP